MTIDLQKNGRWRVRVTTGAGKRPTIGVYDTEEEALRAEAAAIEVLRDKRETTLGDVIVDSLEFREAHKVTRNPDDDESRYRCHLAPDELMAKPIAQVERRDVVELIARLKKNVRAHQTLRNTLTVLRNGLNFAVEWEMIPASPFANIKLAAPPSTDEGWHYASPREQRHLLETCPAKYRPLVAFAIGTGLRAGELVSLRLVDVHLEAATPYVTVRYGSPPAEPTKNGRIRHVPLLPLAHEAVLSQLSILAQRADNPRGILFPTERERTFRDPDHVLPYATWEKIRAPLGNRLRWHDLRHTCASSLVSGWWGRRWSLEEVCALLGHSDIRVTQRYAHLAQSALMRAADETPGEAAAKSGGRDGGPGEGGSGDGTPQIAGASPLSPALTTAVLETAPYREIAPSGKARPSRGLAGPGEVRAGLVTSSVPAARRGARPSSSVPERRLRRGAA